MALLWLKCICAKYIYFFLLFMFVKYDPSSHFWWRSPNTDIIMHYQAYPSLLSHLCGVNHKPTALQWQQSNCF